MPHYSFLTPIVALSAALVQPGAWATEPDVLPPIVISAGRTELHSVASPTSILLIDRREIDRTAASNLAELLQSRGGIYVRDPFGDGSRAVVDMRGFGSTAGSNILVLVDGRRLNNSSDTAPPDLGTINLADVERVEIIQGSAGTLFGNQAVGGVINVITRRPQGFDATLHGGAGSYHGYSARAHLADRLANGLAYRIDLGARRSDNYRDNNAVERDNLALRIDYEYAAGLAFLEYERVREDLELPGSLFAVEVAEDRRQSAPAYRGDFSNTDTDVTRAGLRQRISDIWSLESDLAYRTNDSRFQISFRAFPGSDSTQKRRVWEFNPRLVGRLPLGRRDLGLTLGGDVETTDYELRTSFGPQGVDQRIFALYGQANTALTDAWNLTLGLRHAGVSDDIATGTGKTKLDDRVTVGSAGLLYDAADGWRLSARIDQNYRFPTVDEHSNIVFGQPIGLDTQKGVSYELGAEWARRALWGKAMLYRLDLKDEISFDSSTFFNINLDKTRRHGAIFEVNWSPAATWQVGASYTYTDSEITAGPFAGNQVPLVPQHNGRLAFDYAPLALPGLNLLAEVIWVGKRVLGGDFANRFQRLDQYSLINLTAGYSLAGWQFSARINNLLGTRYNETGSVGFDHAFVLHPAYFPAPERNFWLTARYEFSN